MDSITLPTCFLYDNPHIIGERLKPRPLHFQVHLEPEILRRSLLFSSTLAGRFVTLSLSSGTNVAEGLLLVMNVRETYGAAVPDG